MLIITGISPAASEPARDYLLSEARERRRPVGDASQRGVEELTDWLWVEMFPQQACAIAGKYTEADMRSHLTFSQ